MKKFLSVIIALAVICSAFVLTACGDGKFYDLSTAYEEGLIDEGDLKSIACAYYDWRRFDPNPYADFSVSTGEIGADIENKLKRAYCEEPEKAEIIKYFGTFSGNIAVVMGLKDTDYEDFDALDAVVGGVRFPNYCYKIVVYR